VDPQRLRHIVDRFPASRIAVLGDFFLDKYLDVDPELAEISLETGKTAHQVVSVRCSPGAAGTVANNLAALGAGTIHALGFVGDDGEGYQLRKALQRLRCDTGGLLAVADRFTPTYLKPRDRRNPDLSGEHERYDTKNRKPVPVDVQDAVLAHLARLVPDVDAVIVLDQVDEAECGIVTGRMRAAIGALAAADPRKVFWADSRSRIGLFRHVIVKVNAGEAVRQVRGNSADAEDDGVIEQAVAELGRRTGKPVFVTAGARGMWVGDPVPTLVPAVRVEGPTDPTGAGDSATAGAVLALCAGASPREAALVANLVASITIEQLATTGTAAPSELEPRLARWRRQTA
jgi:bifunctional ADP-heptose synthase (sugar kinase/adenylyltransferase)